MYTLYHLPFSGDCRIVRIALSEKKIEVKLQVEPVWERRNSFSAKNPEGTVPVLLINDINILCGTSVIVEWLEESKKHPNLLGEDPFQRAEARILMRVQEHIISPRYGGSVIGGIHDHISGAYLLTNGDAFLPKHVVMEVLGSVGWVGDLPEPIGLDGQSGYHGSCT